MEISQKERFLTIIKFAPAVFLVTVSALIIAFLYFENKSKFETEKKDLEEKFVAENKPGLDLIIDITTPSGEVVPIFVDFGVEFFRPFYGL